MDESFAVRAGWTTSDRSIARVARIDVAVLILGVLALIVLAGCSAQTSSDFARISSPSWSSPYLPSGNQPLAPGVEMASWYGPGFQGHPTSSGERFNENGLTAASKTLALGSRVRVINPANGRSVEVRINDRGPFVRGRSLDLSKRAAQRLGMAGSGVAPVVVASADGALPPSVKSARGRVAMVDYRSPRRGVSFRRRIASTRHARSRSTRRHHSRNVWNPVGEWIESSMRRL